MPLSRESLERQLSRANTVLNEHLNSLEKRGIPADRYRRDPIWRNLNAKCRDLTRRLRRVAAAEDLNQEVESRRAEQESDDE